MFVARLASGPFRVSRYLLIKEINGATSNDLERSRFTFTRLKNKVERRTLGTRPMEETEELRVSGSPSLSISSMAVVQCRLEAEDAAAGLLVAFRLASVLERVW